MAYYFNAPDGRVIGRGPAQMPTLDPGTYIIALHAPSEGAPVAAHAPHSRASSRRL